MDYDEFKAFFEKCGGRIEQKKISSHSWRDRFRDNFISPKTLDLSASIYMKIVGGPKPRRGAISRFVGFVYRETYYSFFPSIEVEWDDRDKNLICSYYDVELLDENYSDGTKWIWKTETRVKEEIPTPNNKYGQELEIGSLVVGVQKVSKRLMFGYVTRYTKANVWIKPIHFPCDSQNEVKEIQLDNFKQICLFQEDFLEHLLVLKLMANY